MRRTLAALLIIGCMHGGSAVLTMSGVPGVRGALHAQTPKIDDVQGVLDERTASDVAGIVATIVTGGTARTWTSGRPQPDAQAVFEIGSVSKALTGLLLADMVVRGEVALDDPVSRYLPAGVTAPSRDGREITLLDLATHMSGLPRLPTNLMPADMTDPYATYDAAALHAFLSSYVLQRDPGERYEYSNLGAGLLGYVLALRAARPYEELVIERILSPLGMRDTRITLDPELRARVAQGHAQDGRPVPMWNMNVLAGAGAWRSTAADVRRLLEASLDRDGPLSEVFELAMASHRDTGMPGVRMGLGWHVQEMAGRRLVLHNGRTGGYFAFVAVEPGARAATLLLANTSTPLDPVGLTLVGIAREGAAAPAH